MGSLFYCLKILVFYCGFVKNLITVYFQPLVCDMFFLLFLKNCLITDSKKPIHWNLVLAKNKASYRRYSRVYQVDDFQRGDIHDVKWFSMYIPVSSCAQLPKPHFCFRLNGNGAQWCKFADTNRIFKEDSILILPSAQAKQQISTSCGWFILKGQVRETFCAICL